MRKPLFAFGLVVFGSMAPGCSYSAQPPQAADSCVGNESNGDVTLCTPSADEGFQLAVPAFDVPAGHEVQNCYFFTVPTSQDVSVKRFQIAQNIGSHHMNIFRVASQNALSMGAVEGTSVTGEDGSGECFNSANWSDWPLVMNSQQSSDEGAYGEVDWTLPMSPRGQVVEKFQAGELLMLQTHYVNATTQTSALGRGKVDANFWYADAGSTGPVLTTVFASHPSIEIRPDVVGPQRFDATCNFAHPAATIVGANSHFHSRGVDFTIATATAAGDADNSFYENTSWDNPLIATGLDVGLASDRALRYACTYEYPLVASDGTPCAHTCEDVDIATPSCGLGAQCDKGAAPFEPACGNSFCFGPLVETMEHCNMFVYLYSNEPDPTFEGSKVNCF